MPDTFHLPTAALVAAGFVLLLVVLWWRRRRIAHGFLTEADQLTHEALRSGFQAGRHLRSGLTADTAEKAARHLRLVLGGSALAFCDTQGLLTWTGHGEHHRDQAFGQLARVEVTIEDDREAEGHRPPGAPLPDRHRDDAVRRHDLDDVGVQPAETFADDEHPGSAARRDSQRVGDLHAPSYDDQLLRP